MKELAAFLQKNGRGKVSASVLAFIWLCYRIEVIETRLAALERWPPRPVAVARP